MQKLKTCINQNHNTTNYIYNILWWNARSLKQKEKTLFLYNLIHIHNIDITVVSETWLEDKLKLPDGNFQIYQTRHNAHKGVAIIVKNSIESKEEPLKEYDNCFKLISLRRNNQIKAYILGYYICPTNKKKLLNICKECINKIRMKTKHTQIILAGDFNLNAKDMNLFSNSQNLHIVNNSSITTRSQNLKINYHAAL